jgi:ABC-type multidrug transport system ATPase subunit/ABC-type multidrug transport system permease subunit
VALCVARQLVVTARNKPVSVGGVGRALIVALLLGSLFYQLDHSQSGARSRVGLIYFLLAFVGLTPGQFVPVIVQQRAVYYSQLFAGYYRGAAYFASLVLGALPFSALEIMILCVIVYPMAALQDGLFSERFWFLYVTQLLMNMAGRSFTLVTTALSPSMPIAQAITPVFLVLFNIFAGFLIPEKSIPAGWLWVHYVSYFKYGLRAAALNEYFALDDFRCTDAELLPPVTPLYPQPPPQGFNNVTRVCPLSTGREFLRLYSLDASEEATKNTMLLWLFVLFLGYNLVACLAIVYVDFSGKEVFRYTGADDDEKDGVEARDGGEAAGAGRGVARLARGDSKPVDVSSGAVYLEFRDLSYTVRFKDKKGHMVERRLLDKVFGYAPPGKLVALMGATGAGKSTLLDVLAGRKTEGVRTGSILVNGQPVDPFFSRRMGYVEQFDSHLPTQTVFEAVLFSAELRLPASLSSEERRARVARVLEQLELNEYADDRIGGRDEGGLPPDVRKKVSIAVELVAEPVVLFCDEPTTGLSSAAALEVMRCIRKLANSVSVVCTMHQPSAEIVAAIDWLLLLQPGGQVVYFGEMSGVAEYFESRGLGKYRPGSNMADFAIEIIHQLKANPQVESPHITFLRSELGQRATAELERGVAPKNASQQETKFTSVYAVGVVRQFAVLVQRFWRDSVRDRAFSTARVSVLSFVALLLGSVFFRMAPDQRGSQNRTSVMFVTTLFTNMSAQAAIPKTVSVRESYFRERKSNMYSPLPFHVARFVADVPWLAISAFVFSTLVYWMCGLNDSDDGVHHAQHFAIVLVGLATGFGFAELCATAAPDAQVATALSTLSLVVMMLFAGFLIQESAIPRGWIFMFYINILRYPLFYLLANEFGNLALTCPPDQATIFRIDPNNPACATAPLSDANCFKVVCRFSSGQQQLAQFSVDSGSMAEYFWASFAFLVGFRVLAYLALRFINHVKR